MCRRVEGEGGRELGVQSVVVVGEGEGERDVERGVGGWTLDIGAWSIVMSGEGLRAAGFALGGDASGGSRG